MNAKSPRRQEKTLKIHCGFHVLRFPTLALWRLGVHLTPVDRRTGNAMLKAITRKDQMMSNSVRFHRVLRATPEKIYRAFLDADAMAKWLPPNGFTGKVHHLDAKVGG